MPDVDADHAVPTIRHHFSFCSWCRTKLATLLGFPAPRPTPLASALDMFAVYFHDVILHTHHLRSTFIFEVYAHSLMGKVSDIAINAMSAISDMTVYNSVHTMT
jgi:hypothetical protein